MTAAHAPPSPGHRRTDFERWRRRSRLIRTLRIVLPAVIVAALAGGRLAGVIALLACLFGGWMLVGLDAVRQAHGVSGSQKRRPERSS